MSVSIPILLYHRIDHGASSTPASVFAAHMAYLAARKIRTLTLDEFEQILGGRQALTTPAVLLTFDDGSVDCLHEVLPVLEANDQFATGFLITGRMRGSQPLGQYDNALSWDEARELVRSGRFQFQSHSHSHTQWPFDQGGIDALAAELALSRETLARELDRPIEEFRHLAWPWGRCNLDFERIAAQLGYSYQYLVQTGSVKHLHLTQRLPRICCDGMPLQTFRHWLELTTSGPLSGPVNLAFGLYRKARHGMGYW